MSSLRLARQRGGQAVSATDILKMVYVLLPAAFLADLLVFTFGIWWINRWRKARAFRKKIEPYSLHR